MKNKNYVTTLLGLQAQINEVKATPINNVRTEYKQQVVLLNTTDSGSKSVVASLVSRYNTLRETRDFANNAVMGKANTAVAGAQSSLNNASLGNKAFSDFAMEQGGVAEAKLRAAQGVLTSAEAGTNQAVAVGNRALAQSARTITDLATEINTVLAGKINAINSNAARLRTSVSAMLTELDDTFTSLESSIQRLRAIINADIAKFDEVNACLLA